MVGDGMVVGRMGEYIEDHMVRGQMASGEMVGCEMVVGERAAAGSWLEVRW